MAVDEQLQELEAEGMSRESLAEEVGFLYNKISELESLHPSQEVNALFSQLVGLCLRPCRGSLDMEDLEKHAQDMRAHLIRLCGEAEGLLETHYAKLLGAFPHPLSHLALFPYYANYRKLAHLEYQLLCRAYEPAAFVPSKVAFVGSGPLPLTTLVLALHHLPGTHFDNFDMDAQANVLAQELVLGHGSVAQRMGFHTCNVKKVRERLAEYEVVFLAALVGLDSAAKREIIAHLAKYMKAGATLVVRSAHAARAFLYPVVYPDMLQSSAFQVLSVFHPSDEVVNSIIIARLLSSTTTTTTTTTTSSSSCSSSSSSSDDDDAPPHHESEPDQDRDYEDTD